MKGAGTGDERTGGSRPAVGAFGDLGAHALDLLLWLAGEDASAVGARLGTTGHLGGGVDEWGEGLLRLAGGTTGSLAAGWVGPDAVSVAVEGTRGAARVSGGEFRMLDREGAVVEAAPEPPPALPHPLAMLLDAVHDDGDHALLVGAEEAARRNELMDELYDLGREP